MLTFAICVACAGALLGLAVRLPALVLVLCALTAAIAAGALATDAGNGAVGAVVAALALQTGYALAIIARGAIAQLRGERPAAPLPAMHDDYPVDASVQDGRSRNHP